MSYKKDMSGAAFPTGLTPGHYSQEGMSLRDWFAGQVLTGTIAGGNVGINTTYEDLARVCYRQADAMLEARK